MSVASNQGQLCGAYKSLKARASWKKEKNNKQQTTANKMKFAGNHTFIYLFSFLFIFPLIMRVCALISHSPALFS